MSLHFAELVLPIIAIVWALRVVPHWNPRVINTQRTKMVACLCVGLALGSLFSQLDEARMRLRLIRREHEVRIDFLERSMERNKGDEVVRILREHARDVPGTGGVKKQIKHALRRAARRGAPRVDRVRKGALYARLKREFKVDEKLLDLAASKYQGDVERALLDGAIKHVARPSMPQALSQTAIHMKRAYFDTHDCDDAFCETSLEDKVLWQLAGIGVVLLFWGDQRTSWLYRFVTNLLLPYGALSALLSPAGVYSGYAIFGGGRGFRKGRRASYASYSDASRRVSSSRGGGFGGIMSSTSGGTAVKTSSKTALAIFAGFRLLDLATNVLVAHHPVLHRVHGSHLATDGKAYSWTAWLSVLSLAAATWNSVWHIAKFRDDLMMQVPNTNALDAFCSTIAAVTIVLHATRTKDTKTLFTILAGLVACFVLFNQDFFGPGPGPAGTVNW